jgi:O-antigen/teichoic acid export membrane protein
MYPCAQSHFRPLLWVLPPCKCHPLSCRRVDGVNQMAEHEKVRVVRSQGGKGFAALRNPLYRTSYALLVNTAATTAVGVAFWAVAAHFYDQQVLGRSAALVSALLLVSTFAQLNLTTALPRFLPKAGRSAGKFIAYSYGASSCAALIGGLAFVTVLPRLSSQWQFVANSLPLAVAFVLAAAVWQVFTLQDIVLLSLRRPFLVPTENFVYGVSKLLMLVGIVSLLSSAGIFLSWVVPLAVTVPAVNWLIFRRFLKERDAAATPSRLRAREVVRFASVDYIGSVLGQAYGSLLPLLDLSTLGAAANSSFYIAWSIASGLGLVASNFGTSLLIEGADAPDRLADLTRGVLARCIVIMSLGAALIGLAARPILDVYGSRYAVHASSLLGLLAVGTIPSCIVVVAMSLDRIAGRVGRATLTRLVLTVLVLSGSWLLARKVGIDGVAYAWGGANLVLALARFPTIVGAIRGQMGPTPISIPVRRPLAVLRPPAPGPSQLPSLHSRPAAGRHRAGALRVDPAERPGHLRHPLVSPVVHASTLSSALDPTGQTARALELLISLGTEVD